MIPSVYIGPDSILVQQILDLHAPGPRVLDVTYGHGRFWATHLYPNGRHTPYQVTGLDVRVGTGALRPTSPPALAHLVRGTWERLPFTPRSFDVVICDPPFIARGGVSSIMAARYDSFRSYQALILSLARAAHEFARVLGKQGIVVLKAMDLTSGRRRRWTHHDIQNAWAPLFRLDDLFIKVATQPIESPTWKTQQRSRAAHTYFMVFRPISKRRGQLPLKLDTAA